MKYKPLNDNVLIKKVDSGTLVIAGQDEEPNSILTGVVISSPPYIKNSENDLCDKHVKFIRGQARAIKLDGNDFFLVKKTDLLMIGDE